MTRLLDSARRFETKSVAANVGCNQCRAAGVYSAADSENQSVIDDLSEADLVDWGDFCKNDSLILDATTS